MVLGLLWCTAWAGLCRTTRSEQPAGSLIALNVTFLCLWCPAFVRSWWRQSKCVELMGKTWNRRVLCGSSRNLQVGVVGVIGHGQGSALASAEMLHVPYAHSQPFPRSCCSQRPSFHMYLGSWVSRHWAAACLTWVTHPARVVWLL